MPLSSRRRPGPKVFLEVILGSQSINPNLQAYGQADQDQFQFCQDHPFLASWPLLFANLGADAEALGSEMLGAVESATSSKGALNLQKALASQCTDGRR